MTTAETEAPAAKCFKCMLAHVSVFHWLAAALRCSHMDVRADDAVQAESGGAKT